MNVSKRFSYPAIVSYDDVTSLFPRTPDDVHTRGEQIKKEVTALLDVIIARPADQRTFDNTVRALDVVQDRFSIVYSTASIFEMISPDKEIRDACRDVAVDLHAFTVDAFSLNVPLYEALQQCYTTVDHSTLSKEERYYFDETMKDFKRAGLALPPEKREQVAVLKKELGKLTTDFDSNIANDDRTISVPRSELDGLDESFITSLKRDGEQNVLGIDYPTYFMVMKHCRVSKTRRQLYLTFQNRAYPQNSELLEKIRKKRHELAKLLGYDTFADYEIEAEMAERRDRVETFLKTLLTRVKPKMEEELEMLRQHLPASVLLTEHDEFEPWDLGFVREQYIQQHFNVDERKVAEYFPMRTTIDALFDIYQQFFNITFDIVDNPRGVWHESVQVIEVYDNVDNQIRGYIFLDLYPRPHKYSHACHADFVNTISYRVDGEEEGRPNAAVVVANFPPPTSEMPPLLKHNEVSTFFHEFGHALHAVLGQTRFSGTSGTNVKRDFVEMPSQMFEEWLWDKKVLKQVSSHYETHMPLPDELIGVMLKLKNVDSGYFVARQCWLALISLQCYADMLDQSMDDIIAGLAKRYIPGIRFEPDTHFQAGFGHLTGYGSRYYGYMWSKVFALDLFEHVKQYGLLDAGIGRKLVEDVLGRGGSADPDELLELFLGRAPNQKAFLRDIGVDE